MRVGVVVGLAGAAAAAAAAVVFLALLDDDVGIFDRQQYIHHRWPISN